MTTGRIGVALKWVPFTQPGEILDPRFGGLSAADKAALETALILSEAWSWPCLAVSAGPEVAAQTLRVAWAAGCAEVLRIDCPREASRSWVARALGRAFVNCDVIICGDYSLDRGSGSIPAFLAAECDAVQALGVATVRPGEPGVVVVERRIEAGYREGLRLAGRCVISVEPQAARLRRASLPMILTARAAAIAHAQPAEAPQTDVPAHRRPFRPRAKQRPPPKGSPLDRITSLFGLDRPVVARQQIELPAEAAADRIIQQLEAWAYIDEPETLAARSTTPGVAD
jgi:electron transfer flavoprotein beta subunit